MKGEYTSFKELTTFKVGGDIRSVVTVDSLPEFVRVVDECDQKKQQTLILGTGSNILASDEFFDGVVVRTTANTIVFEKVDDNNVRVIADAGVSWDAFVLNTIKNNLWGLENLSGIPGTVGAAPIQNIGAYGTDISKTLEWVEVYDRQEKNIITLAREMLGFGYRTSLFKQNQNRYLILRVSFLLSLQGTPNTVYKDLGNYFEGKTPMLAEIRDAVLLIRKSKFPDLHTVGTAGSFFMNPIVSRDEASLLKNNFPGLPQFEEGNDMKISLAWVLDHVVDAKGMYVGGASVWEKQPLVLITKVGATAADVKKLSSILQKKVFEKIKINIKPEVNIF